MNNIRWTSLPSSNSFSQNSCAGAIMVNGMTSSCHGVDEFVLDPSLGTFASLQEPPSLISMLNSGRACSFIS